MSLRHQAISAFRQLLRTSRTVFGEDFEAYHKAREEIKFQFRQQLNVVDKEEITELIKVATEADRVRNSINLLNGWLIDWSMDRFSPLTVLINQSIITLLILGAAIRRSARQAESTRQLQTSHASRILATWGLNRTIHSCLGEPTETGNSAMWGRGGGEEEKVTDQTITDDNVATAETSSSPVYDFSHAPYQTHIAKEFSNSKTSLNNYLKGCKW